jgi:two-component system, OmpR family, phosphate regulon sensor histidine kinase PhoR
VGRQRKLIWHLYPSYLLITLISLGAVTWYASRSIKNFYLEQTAQDLRARVLLVDQQIKGHLNPLDEKGIDLLCKKIGVRGSTRITITLPSGKVVGDSEEAPVRMDNHSDRPEIIQALKRGQGISSRYSRTLEKNMMYVALPVGKGHQITAVVRVAIPVDAIDRTIDNIQQKIVIGGLFIAALAALLSLLISRRITLPITQIKSWAESVAGGEFRARPPVSGPEEIEALSVALNKMASELQGQLNGIIRQRNEMEAVLSSMAEGVIALDMEERVISMNHAAGEMLACNPSEAKGRSIQEVVRNTILYDFVTRALSATGPLEKDIVISTGDVRFFNAQATNLQDASGTPIGALIVLNDFTRLRRLENIRRDFVANASHEIKTPITAIKGSVETLRDGAMNSDDADRFLDILDRHVNRLMAIIEDLLSLSRIEQQNEKQEIDVIEGDVRQVLQSAVQLCDVAAAAKGIAVEISCPENIFAKMDVSLLEKAVVNLLDNAIKYSPDGSVIQVKAVQEENETTITVRDQGCGIEKKHLPRVFERFYRVDKARSRQLGGTGLGLAIVKHIVQVHAGKVSVESTLGKGSTFTIHLPLA